MVRESNFRPERRTRKRGTALRGLLRATGLTAAFGAASCMLVPLTAFGAPAAKPLATGTAVGTLPLLASLGFGIAVAVLAVIAFLQMTAKGRLPVELADGNETEEGDPFGFWEAERQAAEGGTDAADFEDGVADFTIPLSRIPADQVSPVSGNEDGPRICGVGGEFAGASFRLGGLGLSIGRDPAVCHIVFPVNVGEVSRRHCTLRYEEESGMFLLEDHGSSNGTFLSRGERLQPGKYYSMRSGERFALSGDVHWFEVKD